MMSDYWLFFLITALTVLTPGPGVVMTITNTLSRPRKETLGGILGIAFGTLILASLSGAGLGVLITSSAVAFGVFKAGGAVYLIYLGVRLWRRPTLSFERLANRRESFALRFAEGVTLQVTNPKVIVFFLSILPQFLNPAQDYLPQFLAMVLTYSGLVLVVHGIYSACAGKARVWLTSEEGNRMVNRIGGGTFIFFGATLAMSRK